VQKARATPLLPEAGAAGAPLTIVIAILAFMASVALIANLTVSRAVKAWTGHLTGTVTVQVRGASPEAVEDRLDEAVALLSGTEGVLSVKRLGRKEAEALLAPWFDTGLPADIPVPGLVTARVSPELRADLSGLKAAVSATTSAVAPVRPQSAPPGHLQR
jgi:cell division transport system permease protein